MNDRDYAVCIYLKTFGLEDSCDVCIQGVLEAISTLPQQEQLALEYHFRSGMTYKKTGEKLGGISIGQARHLVNRALRMLRHPIRAKKRYVATTRK